MVNVKEGDIILLRDINSGYNQKRKVKKIIKVWSMTENVIVMIDVTQ